MKSSRRGDFHHTVAVASESPCCLFAPVLELNLDTEAVELSSLFFSEARRGCQIYTGVPLHCFSSFPALNGRRMPALSESRLAPSCWGRFALLCQDPAGQGASFCGGWAHGPVPRGSSWDVAALHLSAMALGMWKQGWGERGLPVCLPTSRGQMLWSRGDWLQAQVVPQAGCSSTEMPHGNPACLC